MGKTKTRLDSVEQRVRLFATSDFALRAADDTEPAVFTGHAAVFDSRTAIGNPLTWGFYEEIASGAFAKTLREGDARFLVDHDTSLLVARVSAGDLRLAEDKVGLATEADLDTELSYVRDLVRNLEKRRITGMSFGFRVVKDDWTTETVSTSDGQAAEVEIRTIREVELFEVSAVTFPAYEETDAALRAVQHRADPDPLRRRSVLLGRNERAVSILPEVGSRVTIDPGHAHDPAHTTGTVAEIGTTAYGVVMDAMPEMGVHRWYTADEFTVTDAEDDTSAGGADEMSRHRPSSLGRNEPAAATRQPENTSQPGEPTGTPLALIKRRHSLNAAKYGVLVP